ncbi:AGROH133_08824 family phage infection protein [Pseudochrobactrum sp. HB0163]|uniref:AGROH133_08824 family phage infection protein n=1 Tax=Pseudochrobactrum sp. HB0163 TaxID=3450708 RepID=UPI003F6DA9FD
MSFYLPSSQGEWLAWTVGVITLLFGLLLMFAPAISLKILRLSAPDLRVHALSSVRATMAGPYIGLAVACLLFAQPFLWMALGCVWGFVLFGRLISMMSDKANTFYNWIAAVIELLLAALPLLFAFGFIR